MIGILIFKSVYKSGEQEPTQKASLFLIAICHGQALCSHHTKMGCYWRVVFTQLVFLILYFLVPERSLYFHHKETSVISSSVHFCKSFASFTVHSFAKLFSFFLFIFTNPSSSLDLLAAFFKISPGTSASLATLSP